MKKFNNVKSFGEFNENLNISNVSDSEKNMIGVYTLANDNVIEHFIAFVKSFRQKNPKMPLTVIAFDDNCDQIKKIIPDYNFDLWKPDQSPFMEEIGRKFYPTNNTWQKGFKKICCFWGKYDTFLFLDSDIIVLENLDNILTKFSNSKSDFLYFDFDVEWVYKGKIFIERMKNEFDSKFINAGTWGGKKDVIKVEFITTILTDYNNFRENLVDVIEQPFLNYCIDLARLKKIRIDELDSKYSFSCWFNLEFYEEDGFIFWKYNGELKGQMVCIHWAGCNIKDIYKHHSATYFLRYRLLNESIIYKYRYFLRFYGITSRQFIFQMKYVSSFLKLLNLKH